MTLTFLRFQMKRFVKTEHFSIGKGNSVLGPARDDGPRQAQRMGLGFGTKLLISLERILNVHVYFSHIVLVSRDVRSGCSFLRKTHFTLATSEPALINP